MAITLVYGTYTIPFIIDKFRETESYRHYRIDVDFLITATTDADFKTALAAAEDALTADTKKLTVSFGSSVHRTFDPADYSGLKARGTLSKAGGELDTDRSRAYTWSCEIDLPASSAADLYRREATWQLSYTETRQPEITFQGTYTAGNSLTAKANYSAQAPAWISSVFTALSLTEANFELLNENINAEDDESSILSFTRTYRQIRFTWHLSYTENNRLEITMQGKYYPSGGSSGKQIYDANIATYVASVFSGLSETEASFELVSEQEDSEDATTGVLSFTRIYREVLFNESAAALNHAAIKSAVASFARSYSTEAAVGSVGTTYIDISYSCIVDSMDATYGSVGKLDDLWKDVIRPHLLTQAKTLWIGSFAVIESENTTLNPSEFSIQSSIRVLTASRSNMISYVETVELSSDLRWTYNALLDGQDDTYTYWSPGRRLTAIQTVEIKKIAGFPGGPPLLQPTEIGMQNVFGMVGNGGVWNIDSDDIRYSPSVIGQSPDAGLTTKNVYTVTYARRYTYINKNSSLSRISSGMGRDI